MNISLSFAVMLVSIINMVSYMTAAYYLRMEGVAPYMLIPLLAVGWLGMWIAYEVAKELNG